MKHDVAALDVLVIAGRPARAGGARIETRWRCARCCSPAVAPPARAGRGLKLTSGRGQPCAAFVAPPARAGRGLKLHDAELQSLVRELVAPPARAGRGLKPAQVTDCQTTHVCRPARAGGARIETNSRRPSNSRRPVAPPARAGRGLKLYSGANHELRRPVAPPARAGRGLKPVFLQATSVVPLRRPARAGGARIETRCHRQASRRAAVSPRPRGRGAD